VSTGSRSPAPNAAAAPEDTSAQAVLEGLHIGRERAPRLLVVSHPAVLTVNQTVYRELAARGWSLTLVVPRRWRHSYSDEDIVPSALPGLEGALVPLGVLLPGRPQRHLYATVPARVLARARADVAFLELEPFALAARQWEGALRRAQIPFGVQCYENIDRALPAPVRRMRTRTLTDATFVAARSPEAGELARRWGAAGAIGLAPPAVPGWDTPPRAASERPFTVGFAGRLVESKGLADLLAAVRALAAPVELLLVGDGPMRGELEGQEIPGSHVKVLDGFTHERMADAYAQVDVVVLPSRTTPTWKEQFGRVIIEALWCGVPVVGSDSGAIPWLIGLTGGGLTFPEGDVGALAQALDTLRSQPELRAELARRGRAEVESRFTVAGATDALESLLAGAMGHAILPAPGAEIARTA
jgi:glycosyltransferase involved in cell wall biosynthesis